MILERPATARGAVDQGWLQSHHTFSFGHFYDPDWMGFGVLRVINDDTVAPGGGFAPHSHANMEIISVVLEGALAHKDSAGNAGVIRAGDVQWMSAGRGIEHSEFNGSQTEPVHFLQIWLQTDRLNAVPAYDQKHFDPDTRRARWVALATPDGAEGSIAIRQQARLLATRLEPGDRVAFAPNAARRHWLHVASGEVQLDGRKLVAGDALGFVEESATRYLTGYATADVLLFELP